MRARQAGDQTIRRYVLGQIEAGNLDLHVTVREDACGNHFTIRYEGEAVLTTADYEAAARATDQLPNRSPSSA